MLKIGSLIEMPPIVIVVIFQTNTHNFILISPIDIINLSVSHYLLLNFN